MVGLGGLVGVAEVDCADGAVGDAGGLGDFSHGEAEAGCAGDGAVVFGLAVAEAVGGAFDEFEGVVSEGLADGVFAVGFCLGDFGEGSSGGHGGGGGLHELVCGGVGGGLVLVGFGA